jgi:predicted nucleic acid-binding protein
MAVTTWLIDKSAYVRLGTSPDRELWAERISRGLVHLSSLTLLEIGYSFRSAQEAERELHSAPLHSLVVDYLTPSAERRAHLLQMELLKRSQHRGVSIPDLLLAAQAELLGHTLLHVDNDFELISAHSGVKTERLLLDG